MLSAGVVIGLILLVADAAILWKLVEQIRWPDFHQAMLVSISSTALAGPPTKEARIGGRKEFRSMAAFSAQGRGDPPFG